ncbi:receptor-type tyrosine-protein phosphatase eta isoform X2 [Salvelinus namaycush]|uniref:Receptor-type tyrosine-protein phosphatase eta isoform X2 n=1 Tax=Salvelinus namaycush TaxID=8040 RepID=A0A8U1FB95_SALNM|nr:receptor-type tyrosine-protein phosphatase eta isoform X2 [Salvelinus namaycush]
MFGIMSRMSCFGVLLRTSVVLYLFLKGSQAQCAPCMNLKASTTATEINIQVHSNCNLSTGSTSVFTNSTMATLSGLAPGSTHLVRVLCNDIQQVNCCNNFTTKPAVIATPTVIQTTTSLFLSWTKPTGEAAGYRVEFHNGGTGKDQLTSTTSAIIESLTQGTQYTLKVIAIAQDKITEGDPRTVYVYTKPGVVGNLSVIGTTTSSVYLSWTQPKGNSSFYRVEGTGVSMNTTETSTTITGLTAGVQYSFTVTAVAGDKTTVGEGNTTTTFTSKSSFKFGV